jgi:hypothetical protein
MSRSQAALSSTNQQRTSNGLDQFFASLRDRENLSLIDLAGASQANISFITELGHRLYADDMLRSLDDAFGPAEGMLERQAEPARIEQFLALGFDFPECSVDGALVWDTLQFLGPDLLQALVDRLFHIMRPDAHLLAIFHGNEKVRSVPTFYYRITSARTVTLVPRGERTTAQVFNNRLIEKLFQNWGSIKFYVTRDNLREVMVRR